MQFTWTVKKNTFYLTGQDITLRSDHLPLKKLDIDPDISVGEKLATVDDVDICEINITYDNPENSEFSVQLPLSNEKFVCLQEKDAKIHQLQEKVKNGLYSDFYVIRNDILYRSIIDNGHKFDAAVVPEDLTGTVLHLGHNQSGHNGYQRMYAAIKCVYYWKGMRKHILVHCKNCIACAKQKVQKTQLKSKYLNQVYNQWNLCALISLVSFTLLPQKLMDMHLLLFVC